MNFESSTALRHLRLYFPSVPSGYLSMTKQSSSWDACALSGHGELKPSAPNSQLPMPTSCTHTTRPRRIQVRADCLHEHHLISSLSSWTTLTIPGDLPGKITWLFDTETLGKTHEVFHKTSTDCLCPMMPWIPVSTSPELWQVPALKDPP